MTLRRRLGLIALFALSAALAGLAVSEALKDKTPPQLYYEVPEAWRMADGTLLMFLISADEPVSYTLEYAGSIFEAVAYDHVFELQIVPGRHSVNIGAVDAAGNRTDGSFELTGAASPNVSLAAAPQLLSGDPLGIRLTWGPREGLAADYTASIRAAWLLLNGEPFPVLPLSTRSMPVSEGVTNGFEALAPTPLVVDPTELTLEAAVEDEFGRVTRVFHTVVLDPLPVVVEQLQLSSSVLSVITPEGRELEARTWEEATAKMVDRPLWTEPFLMPITGVFTSGFADARRYVVGGPVSFHNGLDLAAPTGTPIAATNAGTVLVAGPYPIKGGWVMIDHGGGVASHYFHMSSIDVTVGQTVQRGEIIGGVGTTGLSTGPHLHWEMRVHNGPTSPMAWVDRMFP